MKITVIAAALPPQLDGIGDYTAHFAAEVAQQASVKILVPEGPAYLPIPGVEVVSVFSTQKPSSVKLLADVVTKDEPDWVLLQYNPISYGPYGWNPSLPLVLAQIKRRCPGTKIAVMVHETFVPPLSWKLRIMGTWQRWQLWQIGRTADVLFFSIAPWVLRFRHWFPDKPIHHLPVGSNIPQVQVTRQEARRRLGIGPEVCILGLFGSAQHQPLLGAVRDAAQAIERSGRPVMLLYVGVNKTVCEALRDVPMIADGPLPAEEVSRRFAAMDIYMALMPDGVSTRRGSLMAALQHGVATVGTRGVLTDESLLEQDGKTLLLAGVEEPMIFVNQVLSLVQDNAFRHHLGQAGRHLYEREFSWACIGNSVLAQFNKDQK